MFFPLVSFYDASGRIIPPTELIFPFDETMTDKEEAISVAALRAYAEANVYPKAFAHRTTIAVASSSSLPQHAAGFW